MKTHESGNPLFSTQLLGNIVSEWYTETLTSQKKI